MLRVIAKGINYLLGSLINRQHIHITDSLNYVSRKREIDRNYFDYIRLATLELVSDEINARRLKGSVAEVGVYKGKFARYINRYFPNRTLYLFDTFEGFDGRDVTKEKKLSYSSGNQDFSDTSVDAVLKIMPHPQNCIVKKGYFPDTAKDVDDSFVFVSIDADLYEPIYASLVYFYPRLQNGGYIFIHDYNNELYKGAKEAVDTFCSQNNINRLPLPDSGGTAIILK